MPNPFGKSRPIESPYAIYTAGDFTWHVIKTYKMPKSELKDPFARWMVAAKSDATFGSFELADTYARDVKQYGQLVAAEMDWIDAHGSPLQKTRAHRLPTPAQWLELEGASS